MTRKAKPPIAIYSALADATRCRIVEILLAGPIPVHKLADAFAISRPAISRHLRVLKTAGLVAEVKKGRENLYALRPAKLGAAVTWIGGIVAPVGATGEAPQAEARAEPVAMDVVTPAPVSPAKPSKDMSPPPAESVALTETIAQVEKPAKAARVARPEPAISQMGFDF